MKKYNFLFKPVFFICSLVFATWLVLYIEKLAPSDFGKYEYIFNSGPGPISKKLAGQPFPYSQQQYTCSKKICKDYKAGLIDSANLDQQLKEILNSPRKISKY